MIVVPKHVWPKLSVQSAACLAVTGANKELVFLLEE